MGRSQYTIIDRYELPCVMCSGLGCMGCRQGMEPVYVLVASASTAWCRIRGHDIIGHTERATDAHQLPHVAWCVRCGWQQVHTDVPEAYDLAVERTA